MNITVISFEFPPEPGGIGEYAYQTALKLSEAGHSVQVINSNSELSEEEFTEFSSRLSFSNERLTGYNGRTFFLLRKILFFKTKISLNNSNLIIAVSPTAGIIARLFKWFYSIPYIIIGHGSEFLASNIIHELLIKFCYDGADLILPNSAYTFSLLNSTRIKNKNIKILYPGADEDLFDYSKYRVHKSGRKKIILTVGALSVRKGHKQIIDAIKILSDHNFNIEYWIIGKGTEKENLRDYIIKMNLEEQVKIIGFVPRENLPEYYHKADLFVLGSNDLDNTQVEGFGIVLVEANLMKKPLIGSRNTGMEEIIVNGINGFLVDSKKPEDIAEKIKKVLYDNDLAQRMGQKGYDIAIKKFTWTKFGDELNSLIISLFKNRFAGN